MLIHSRSPPSSPQSGNYYYYYYYYLAKEGFGTGEKVQRPKQVVFLRIRFNLKFSMYEGGGGFIILLSFYQNCFNRIAWQGVPGSNSAAMAAYNQTFILQRGFLRERKEKKRTNNRKPVLQQFAWWVWMKKGLSKYIHIHVGGLRPPATLQTIWRKESWPATFTQSNDEASLASISFQDTLQSY